MRSRSAHILLTAIILALPIAIQAQEQRHPPITPVSMRTIFTGAQKAEARIVIRNLDGKRSIKGFKATFFALDPVDRHTIGGFINVQFSLRDPVPPGRSAEATAILDDAIQEGTCRSFRFDPGKDSKDGGMFTGRECAKLVFLIDFREVQFSDRTSWNPS